jgi:putative methionine-R-sulfoxide reductase with GAF domain
MRTSVRQLLSPPLFEDPEKSRSARFLHSLLLLTVAATLLGGAIALAREPGDPGQWVALSLLIEMAGLLWLVRQGRVRVAAWAYMVTIWLLLALATFLAGGLNTPAFSAYFVAIVVAGLLLGGRAAIGFAAASTLSGLIVLVIEAAGRLPESIIAISPAATLLSLALLFFLVALAVFFSRTDLESTFGRMRQSEREVARMKAAFRAEQARLEERVAERTRALVTSAEVSRRLSTILDRQQLVTEVVEQIQAAFDYYHVHIYLFDEAGQFLVMAGGTGEPGRAMLIAGHKLPRGRGLVGRAAETGRDVVVPDVSAESAWLPNPLLPDTRAEIATPILVGDRVLGVLDVQHNVKNGLQDDDSILLHSIANQVAVALENARLYNRARRQAEREALVNTIGRRIQRATTIEGVLQVAAQELGQAFDAPRTIVQIASPAKWADGQGDNAQ